MLPLITVIIPVYKVEPYIHKCIDSVIKQTYTNLEIILVVSDCGDNCGKICDEYAAKDTRIVVLHTKPEGLSAARNAGLDIAKGEYIGFVDSDDWIEPDMYECLFRLLEKNDADISVCGYNSIYTDRQVKCNDIEKEILFTSNEIIEQVYVKLNINIAVWDRLYRKRLFDNIRFPIGKEGEDTVTSYELFLLSDRIACTPRPEYNYLIREDNLSNAALTTRSFTVMEEWERAVNLATVKSPQYAHFFFAVMMRAHVAICKKLYCSLKQGEQPYYRDEYAKIISFTNKYYRQAMGEPALPLRHKAVLTILNYELYPPFRSLGRK